MQHDYPYPQNPEAEKPYVREEVRQMASERLGEVGAAIDSVVQLDEIRSQQADNEAAEAVHAFNQASTDEVQAAVSTELGAVDDNVIPLFGAETTSVEPPSVTGQLDVTKIRDTLERINDASKAA